MKLIQYITVCSCLLASPLLHSVSWGQTRPKSVSVAEAASIEGTILDAATGQPIEGATILARNKAGKFSAQHRVGPNGVYHLGLNDSKQEYLLITSATGYEPLEERIAFTTAYSTQLSNKAIRLYKAGTKPVQPQTASAGTAPVATSVASATSLAGATVPTTTAARQPSAGTSAAVASPRLTPPKTLDAKVVYTPPLVVAAPGKTTQLRAIQFVQSKAELLADAQPALEQLADFLKNNPTTEIELAGHTDNQGDFDENIRLSRQRVEVVKAYLVANGIAANRIATRGYGPTRPIGSNNAENTRQLNRRVEMTILKQ